jgi:hypothetical protein
VAAAIALHALVPAVAAVVPPRVWRDRLVVADPLRVVDIEPFAPTEAPREPPPEREPEVDPRTPPDEPLNPRDRRAASRAPRGATPENPAEPVAPGTAQPSDGPPRPEGPPPSEYDPLPQQGPTVFAPGVGQRPVWALPGVLPDARPSAAAPTVSPSARPVDRDIAGKVLRDVQQTRDKNLGLDLPAAGTVASAVADAVRAVGEPSVGKATFEARLGPGGQVLAVRVISSSNGSFEGWTAAAGMAKTRLAGRELVMTGAFVAGAIVYVDVVAKMQLPSGGAGGLMKGGPTPGSAGAGASFDVANAGSKPKRVVASSFRTAPVGGR